MWPIGFVPKRNAVTGMLVTLVFGLVIGFGLGGGFAKPPFHQISIEHVR